MGMMSEVVGGNRIGESSKKSNKPPHTHNINFFLVNPKYIFYLAASGVYQ